MNGKRKRRRLSPSDKYEIYVSVVTGQSTQHEAAEQDGVDRSTVVTACRVTKQGALDALAAAVPGRPGVSRAGGARRGAGRDRAAARDCDRAGGGVYICTREKRVGTDRRRGPVTRSGERAARSGPDPRALAPHGAPDPQGPNEPVDSEQAALSLLRDQLGAQPVDGQR